MATHSSTLAWKIPWTEERGRLQSMGSQRIGHNSVTEQQKQTHKILKDCDMLENKIRCYNRNNGGT